MALPKMVIDQHRRTGQPIRVPANVAGLGVIKGWMEPDAFDRLASAYAEKHGLVSRSAILIESLPCWGMAQGRILKNDDDCDSWDEDYDFGKDFG